jgi:hypothetical protein
MIAVCSKKFLSELLKKQIAQDVRNSFSVLSTDGAPPHTFFKTKTPCGATWWQKIAISAGHMQRI